MNEKTIGNQAALMHNKGLEISSSETGIPRALKQSIEEKSGISLEDVKVSYHSEKPAKLSALAYTQGTRVYIGPGQEACLPHELGHVVQQKQGRVHPTGTVNGQPLNDDKALEQEADRYR